jgi:hypothetical protein
MNVAAEECRDGVSRKTKKGENEVDEKAKPIRPQRGRVGKNEVAG